MRSCTWIQDLGDLKTVIKNRAALPWCVVTSYLQATNGTICSLVRYRRILRKRTHIKPLKCDLGTSRGLCNGVRTFVPKVVTGEVIVRPADCTTSLPTKVSVSESYVPNPSFNTFRTTRGGGGLNLPNTSICFGIWPTNGTYGSENGFQPGYVCPPTMTLWT